MPTLRRSCWTTSVRSLATSSIVNWTPCRGRGARLSANQVRSARLRLSTVAKVSIAINIPRIRIHAAVFDDGAAGPVSGSVSSVGSGAETGIIAGAP